MDINVRTKNLDKLAKSLVLLSEGAQAEMKTTVKRITNNIEANVRKVTPIALIGGGNLRRNTHSEVVGLRGIVWNDARYAKWVHDGTTKWPVEVAPRNPRTVRKFMDTGMEKTDAFIDDEIDKMIENIAGMI